MTDEIKELPAEDIAKLKAEIETLKKAAKPTFETSKPKIDYSGLDENGAIYHQLKGIEQYYEKYFSWFELHMDAKMKAWEDNKEHQVNEVFDKAMGIRDNQPLTLADMPKLVGAVRKAMLETSDTGKKTPATLEKAGPEGNKSGNPIDNLFDSFGGKA